MSQELLIITAQYSEIQFIEGLTSTSLIFLLDQIDGNMDVECRSDVVTKSSAPDLGGISLGISSLL